MSAETASGYVPEDQFDDFADLEATEPYGYDGLALHVQELALATKRAVDTHAAELPAEPTDIEDAQELLDGVLGQAMDASHFSPAAANGLTETSRLLYDYYGYPEGIDKPVEADAGPETAATEEISFSPRAAEIAMAGLAKQLETAQQMGDVAEQTVLFGATSWVMESVRLPQTPEIEFTEDAAFEDERELVAA